jgi:hypothetical protein
MAAGQGFKTFATGDVLTAADTNGYLMQGVWVFANAAARTAAVTSPVEGNMSYLSDTNSVEYYSGSAWVAVGGAAAYVGCAVYIPGTTIALTANVQKILNFSTESFDTDGFHDNSTNNTRITIPSGKSGKYQLDAYWRLTTNVAYANVNLLKNGTGITDGIESGLITSLANLGSNSFAIGGTLTLSLTAGDYIEMSVQSSISSSPAVYARLSATYLGA